MPDTVDFTHFWINDYELPLNSPDWRLGVLE